MTEREALKLALKALEEAWYHVGTFQPTEKAIDLYDEARTAIKEALAQPEPVIDKSAAIRIATALGWEPKRTWVGLTDEEFQFIYDIGRTPAGMMEMVEAKLKEKNS